ncbi:hypothetical protein ES332_D05G426800v1 [Gossypium tomentosum]|uniref:tryptophan synthase n=1 Tax=Gossypium tomentosum TaxID=34277 RepID=A0A5D2L6X9_GOSTO|nr:hypothetical protein ES332_D05G426800v1 [Gossypium tomentosum]
MSALSELETAFHSLSKDDKFQASSEELAGILKDYVGRESPLILQSGCRSITSVPMALLAKRLGKNRTIAETGAGQHGIAIATVCARFGLQCVIYMGAQDIVVHSGTATLKDATSEAIQDWVTNVETTHYILGSIAGPHPYLMMVRESYAVVGKETRKQALEKWGGKPDVLVARVGGGSNAMGLFHEFVNDKDIRLIGVEAAGFGPDSGKHAANFVVAVLSTSVTDEEALEAFKRLSRLEGIIPTLETSYALAYLEKLCPTLPNSTKVVVNCSGRGDKDVQTANKHLQV